MNPELQRNLWLEASPRRAAWAGVVVLLIYGAVALAAGDDHASELLRALGGAGAFIFFASALVWGVRLAGQSVSSEIGERTWDFQRVSALDPWAMTWGKLFGATSLAWMVGLAGLVVAALAYTVEAGPGPGLQFTVAAIALAVLLQAAGFAAALVGVRKARAEGRLNTLRSAAGGLFSVLFVLFAIGVASKIGGQFFGEVGDFSPVGSAGEVRFWGAALDANLFTTLSLVAFAAWALAGAWRLMRLELQKRNGPLFWTAFLLFAAFWAAGLAEGETTGTVNGVEISAGTMFRWFAAAAVFLAGAYAAAFAEPADRVRLRRFTGFGPGWVEQAPAVLPALALGAVALAGVVVSVLGLPLAALPDNDVARGEVALFVAALFAFVLRDMAVIAFFRFGPRPKRGDFGAVLALGLLYGLGGLVAANLGGAVALALPSPEAPLLSLVSGLLQAAVVGFLALRRIRGPEGSEAAQPR
jgi:hypothetical protein